MSAFIDWFPHISERILHGYLVFFFFSFFATDYQTITLCQSFSLILVLRSIKSIEGRYQNLFLCLRTCKRERQTVYLHLYVILRELIVTKSHGALSCSHQISLPNKWWEFNTTIYIRKWAIRRDSITFRISLNQNKKANNNLMFQKK